MYELNEIELLNVSPYDDSFPAKLLSQAFEIRVEEANKVTNKVYNDIIKGWVNNSNIIESGDKKLRIVVDATDDFIEDYKDGVVKLAKEKGKLVAQIRENGRYGEKLAIKEENYVDGPSSLDISNSLQLKSMQDALDVISQQIQAIDESVKEILTGQQNDRLGLYYSGVALYLEAMNVGDTELRKHLIAQSIKALTDASFQLTLSLQTDIRYLKRKEYDLDKKNKFNLINEKISNINQSFSAIHQASILKAGIYCHQGEMKAVANVLQEYSRFIEGTIAGNAYMLSQCDMNDNGKLDGIWRSRAELQLDVKNLVKKLNEPSSILYIESKGE